MKVCTSAAVYILGNSKRNKENIIDKSVLVTPLRKSDSSVSQYNCDWSGDFSVQSHLKLVGRDIDPAYVFGQCTECRSLFVYVLRGLRSLSSLLRTHLASIIAL